MFTFVIYSYRKKKELNQCLYQRQIQPTEYFIRTVKKSIKSMPVSTPSVQHFIYTYFISALCVNKGGRCC